MRKNLKKVLAALIACIFVAGCSITQQGKDVSTSVEYKDTWAADKPATYTIFQYNAKPYDEDYAIFKKAAEMTNITLKGYLAKSVTEEKQAFNLMMASGDIADIVCYNSKAEFSKYGADGAFLPLNDLIDKYAPNIKKKFKEMDDVRKTATSLDGNIYFIPFIADGEVSQVWYMRQDWLDKLNLERPGTPDEFYTVLKAFREKDPNGNGEKDEIPLISNNGKDAFNTILPIFGTTCWYTVDKEGKIHFDPAEEDYKNAYIELAKWYKEGLIDPEIFTRGGTSLSKLLANDQGGSTHAWVGSTAKYNDTLKEKIQGFNWRVVAPPGEKGSNSRIRAIETGWGISSAVKKPEEIIKYFDFWYSDKGRLLANFGVEGEQYDMINGEPIFKPEVLNSDVAIVTQLTALGAQMRIGTHQDFRYEAQGLNEIALEGIKEYLDNSYCITDSPCFLRTAEEEKEYTAIQGVISSYVEEMSQKWIMGMEKPEETFDSYVSKLKNLKLDRLIEIQQAAYERYMKQ